MKIGNKNFNIYLLGLIISNLGNAFTSLVLPLMVLDLTNSPLQVSIISAMKLLPYAVLGLPFGAIIDRVNIKKVMKYSDIIRFAAYLILTIAYVAMPKNILLIIIYIVSIVSGICYVFHSISEVTSIPRIVDKEKLSTANSLIYGSQYITAFVAPMIGGWFYNLDTIQYFFLFDAGTFLMSFISLCVIKGDFESYKKDTVKDANTIKNLYLDIVEGFKILVKEKKIKDVLIIVTISNFILASYYNYSLVYLKNILNVNSSEIGFILGVTSIGALIGTFITPKLSSKMSFYKLIILTLLLDSICRMIIPFTSGIVMLIILLSVVDLAQCILNISIITVRQEDIDKKYLGRINSVFKTVLLGIQPIGLLVGGILLNKIGVVNTLIFTGVAGIMIFIYSVITLNKN